MSIVLRPRLSLVVLGLTPVGFASMAGSEYAPRWWLACQKPG